MITPVIKLRNTPEIRKKIKAITKQFGPEVKKGIDEWRFVTVKKMKSKASGTVLRSRTGRMKRSLTSKYKLDKKDKYYLSMGSWNVPYAWMNEHGGIIRPIEGEYLIFQINGHWVKMSEVRLLARPFIKPTVFGEFPKLQQRIKINCERMFKEKRA